MELTKKYPNRESVLAEVNKMIEESITHRNKFGSYKTWRIYDVCDRLSIFDWWNEKLSTSQLKQMKSFLNLAGELGYNGYVCFKVGAKHCSHGMWASKAESTDGYSPDGACIYHSFRTGDNYYDCEFPTGKWAHDLFPNKDLTRDELIMLVKAFEPFI